MNREFSPKRSVTDKDISDVDKPLTKDRLNIIEKNYRRTYPVVVRSSFSFLPFLTDLSPRQLGAGLFALIAYDGIDAMRTRIARKKLLKENGIHNPTLGYIAERFVYEGDAISVGKDQLTKGDNFYHIQLPGLKPENDKPISADQIATATELYAQSLRRIKEQITNKNYKAVVIEIDNPNIAKKLRPKRSEETDRQTIFTKKPTLIPPEKPCVVMSRETFDSMTEPKDTLLEVTEKLKDSLIRKGNTHAAHQLNDMMKRFDGHPQHTKPLKNYLRRLFATEIDNAYGETRGNAIKKETITIERRRTNHKTYLVKIVTSRDVRKEEPFNLDLNQPLDQIRASQSPAKIALLAYKMEETLEDLTTNPMNSREDDPHKLVTEINQKGIELDTKNLIPVKQHFVPRRTLHKVRPFLAVLAIGATLHATQSGIDLGESVKLDQTNIVTERTPALPEKTPKSHLEWKIKEHGLQHEGYYILSTGDTFEDGKWKMTTSKPKIRELPTSVPSTIPSLMLEKSVKLNFFGKAALKLPLRNETTVGALSIKDKEGKKVPYKAVRYDDGTFGLTIDNGIRNGVETVDIKETLIHKKLSSGESAHATRPIEPIDITKLSPKAKRLASETTIYQLSDSISTKTLYSLDPPNKDVLDHTDGSPESFVNASTQLKGFSCDIANTEFALISSALEQDRFLNIADGFLDINHPAGTDAPYLDDLTRHTFTIDPYGSIQDATPSTLAKDSMTQAYAKALKNTDNLDAQWNAQLNDQEQTADKQQDFYRLLALMGLTVAAGVTTALGYKGSKEVRKHVTRENVQMVKEKTILRFFEKETLANAANFLGWLSWGAADGKQFNELASVPAESREEIAEMIRMNTLKDELDEYIKNPKKYEALAGISDHDARRFRLLARHFRH